MHASISVMVFNSAGDLFLQKRADSKLVEPGKWDTSCSGHCGPGEDFADAARRETEEELGVRPAVLTPFWRRVTGTARQTELIQTYTTGHEGPFRLHPDEISDGRFWTRQEMLAHLGLGVFTTHIEEECLRWFLGAAWPRAVAVDLDGTALTSEGVLPDIVVDRLNGLEARGIRLFLATARPPRSARPFVERLALGADVIYYNGALVACPRTGVARSHRPISAEVARRLVRALRQTDPHVHISLEVLDRWYTDGVTAAHVTQTARLFQPDAIGEIESFLGQPVTKVLASSPGGGVSRLMETVRQGFGGQVSALATDGGALAQITAAGVSKDAALRGLLAEAGIAPRDLLAVGDDLNDLGMLRLAGRGVAMGNAPPAVKDAAHEVTGTNDDLGLAATLEKFTM
jgi:Cof subfamily protein (haloacid dehalogenase superfamily)